MRPFLLLYHYPSVLVKLSTLYSFFTMSMNSFAAFFLPNHSNRLDSNTLKGTSDVLKSSLRMTSTFFSNQLPPFRRDAFELSLVGLRGLEPRTSTLSV